MVLTRCPSQLGPSGKKSGGEIERISDACELRRVLRSRDEWRGFRGECPDIVNQEAIDRCAEVIADRGFEFLGDRVDPSSVRFDPTNYREGFVFQGINSRQRGILLELLADADRRGNKDPAIYAPEALSSLARLLAARFPGFVGSEYMPDPETRAQHPDVGHQDLSSLTFPADRFDYVLVNDVFEHVPDLSAVLAEIFRVLKEGGVLLSTFPFAFAKIDPVVKARLVDGRVEHLTAPEYHGDPVNPKGALVFQVPGWGILDDCRRAGFKDAAMVFVSSRQHGVLASGVSGIMILRAEKGASGCEAMTDFPSVTSRVNDVEVEKENNPSITPEYLFVAGCARSGTTVMRRLISADPNTAIGIERYVRYLDAKGRLTPDLFEPERFFDIQQGDTFYDDFSFLPGYQWVIDRYATAQIRGDKIPIIYDYYPQLEQYFPGAKIVFVLRNLFDVALSFEQRAQNENDRHWPATRNYEAAIREWNRSVRNTLAWAERLDICVVSYENLFLKGIGLDALCDRTGLKRNRLAPRLDFQREEGEELRKQRTESLCVDAKLRILEEADVDAYRQLVSRYLCNPEDSRPALRHEASSVVPGAAMPSPSSTATPAREARKPPVRGLSNYWDIDYEAFDYQCYPIGGYPLWARGPKPDFDPKMPYLVVLGAASAFGRCVAQPYSQLIAQRLQLPVVNLGYGGAKPRLYLEDQGLRRLIEGAKIVICELLSARGISNSFVEGRNSHSAIVRLRGGEAFRRSEPLSRLYGSPEALPSEPGPWVFADHIYEQWVRSGDRDQLQQLVAEVRSNYVSQMRELLGLCSGYRLLFWFSQRSPDYDCSWDNLDGLTGGFPHFVDGAVVSALREHADDYVESCTTVGLPSKMVSRFTGAPVPLFPHNRDASLNDYYPSQEMHALAADAIVAKLRPVAI